MGSATLGDEWPDWPEEERPEDAYVEQAKPELLHFLTENADRLFYLKQLQVLFESKRGPDRPGYYHWITAKGLYRLVDDTLVGNAYVTTPKGTRVRLFFKKGHRYWRRQSRGLLALIDDMSEPSVAEACGEHADVLFHHALLTRGFTSYAEDAREYRGKIWTETDHNLDFIIEKDNLAYGCEVKNKWDYIDRDELRTKIHMCQYLGLRPLFIMRASPTSYNYEIIEAGGYAMIFVSHIYPFGTKSFADRIHSELSLPADSPKAIPAGIIDRFIRWHQRHPAT